MKVDEEIAQLEAKKPQSDADKKQLEECRKTYKKQSGQIDAANLELKVDVCALDPPTKNKDNEGDLKALPILSGFSCARHSTSVLSNDMLHPSMLRSEADHATGQTVS